MYEIGRFAVHGEHEPAPVGFLPIRLVPASQPIGYAHYAAFEWWNPTTQAILRRLPDIVRAGDKVLDFGCGAAPVLSIAAHQLGATPYPVENHHEMILIAQAQLAANGLTMAVVTEPLPAEYDVVLANVGDAALVGSVSRLAPHGVGTDAAGELIEW